MDPLLRAAPAGRAIFVTRKITKREAVIHQLVLRFIRVIQYSAHPPRLPGEGGCQKI
jgi:hypothetical protein